MSFNPEKYSSFLRAVLTQQRYDHSLGVTHVMEELSAIYHLDRTQAMMAGLLHDAAKDYTPEQLMMLASAASITFSHPCERHPVYLHALVSAYLVSRELGVADKLVLDAISAHSYVDTGDSFDAPLSRCLRAADILAPIQEWRGMRKLKDTVYAGQIEEAALLQSGWLVEYFRKENIPVHGDLLREFNTLSAKLKVTDSFFERW